MSTEARPRKHFSMIRGFHLADVFTLGNAACGVGAVFMAMAYLTSHSLRDFLIAAALAPAAFIFDVLDGRVARWRQTHSALGRELDSLADVISFGVAPAALALRGRHERRLGLRASWSTSSAAACRRLARYNVTAETLVGRRRQGRRTSKARRSRPACVLTALLAFAAWQGRIGEPALRRRADARARGSCTRWCCCSRCRAR